MHLITDNTDARSPAFTSAQLVPFRPPLGLAMTVRQLVDLHTEATDAAKRFSDQGDDYRAHDADEAAQAISVELHDRLQSFVGNVALDAVLGAL